MKLEIIVDEISEQTVNRTLPYGILSEPIQVLCTVLYAF